MNELQKLILEATEQKAFWREKYNKDTGLIFHNRKIPGAMFEKWKARLDYLETLPPNK